MRFILYALPSLLALAGCSSGSGGEDVKRPFSPPSDTTTYIFKGQLPTIQATTYYAAVIGEKQVGGQTYLRHKAGYDVASAKELTDQTKGVEIWFNHPEPETLVGGGFADTTVSPVTTPISVTLDQPLTVDLLPPVGVEQTLSASGTALSEGGTPLPASGTANYQLVSDNETVDTGIGPIHGCRHYAGTVRFTGEGVPAIAKDIDIEAELWYHPTFGLVASKVPLAGDMGLESVIDLGLPAEGTNTIQKMGVVDETDSSGNQFQLSSFDVNGQNDATKMKHAKMLLELRWADEADAKTRDAPGYPLASISFNTVWGTFPFELIESPLSIFHPEEAGNGYRYWYAYVDQAAKNEPGEDGISYSIRVAADSMLPPLRCTARIHYSLVQP